MYTHAKCGFIADARTPHPSVSSCMCLYHHMYTAHRHTIQQHILHKNEKTLNIYGYNQIRLMTHTKAPIKRSHWTFFSHIYFYKYILYIDGNLIDAIRCYQCGWYDILQNKPRFLCRFIVFFVSTFAAAVVVVAFCFIEIKPCLNTYRFWSCSFVKR